MTSVFINRKHPLSNVQFEILRLFWHAPTNPNRTFANASTARMQEFFNGVSKVNEELQQSIVQLLEGKEEQEEEINRLKDDLRQANEKSNKLQIELDKALDYIKQLETIPR